MTDREYIDLLRTELEGMVTILETLRSSGKDKYCCISSRGGSFVHVTPAIKRACETLSFELPKKSAQFATQSEKSENA